MKKIIIILCMGLFILNLSEKAFADDNFENKTHLGLNISNFMIKGSVSRDINKDFQTGLNFYFGALSSYDFRDVIVAGLPQNIYYGSSLEFDLKQNLSKNKDNLSLKYFVGTSFINKNYNQKVDGNFYEGYFGGGIENISYINNIGFIWGADLGLNLNFSYNSIGFIFFPRFSLGAETKF